MPPPKIAGRLEKPPVSPNNASIRPAISMGETWHCGGGWLRGGIEKFGAIHVTWT